MNKYGEEKLIFTVKCQLTNAEEVMELENHNLVTLLAITDIDNYQWIWKVMGKNVKQKNFHTKYKFTQFYTKCNFSHKVCPHKILIIYKDKENEDTWQILL